MLFAASCAATQEGPTPPDARPAVDAAGAVADAAVQGAVDAPLVFDAFIPADAGPADARPNDGRPGDACTDNVELCNLKDDNCNNQIDEGYALGTNCSVGKGLCVRMGTTMCAMNGQGTECSATPGTPSQEVCANGMDEDCDGTVDDGFEDLGKPCTSGKGICERSGVFECSTNNLALECSATAGTPAPAELCGNDTDDDCDGMTDEGFQDLAKMCTVGKGICERIGQWACSTDKTMLICNAMPGPPAEGELCANNMDDDCDGMMDEGFPDLNQPCDGSDSDLCNEGKFVCSPDKLSTVCDDGSTNTLDVCDGADNDCDGTSADGSEDAMVVIPTPCTNADDECPEGIKYCAPQGQLLCNDPANDNKSNDPDNCGTCNHLCTNPHGSRICTNGMCTPTCFQGYQSCDADLDDGCEQSRFSDATCSGTCPSFVGMADLGSINADTGGGAKMLVGFDEVWAHVRAHEDSNLSDDLQLKITLTNPAGARFGMRAACYSCGTAWKDTVIPDESGSATIWIGSGDDTGDDDDFDVIIEVFFWDNSSLTCNVINDRWTLKVEESEAHSERDCETNRYESGGACT